MNPDTIFSLLENLAAKTPDATAFRHKVDGAWQSLTWKEAHEHVSKIADSLHALGVQKGDRIAILSQTSLRWVLSDLAAFAVGAVPVGLYQSNLAEECAHILGDCDAVLALVEDGAQLEKIEASRSGLPNLRTIVRMDSEAGSGTDILGWAQFLEGGRDNARPEVAVSRTDLATIVYTSGTTGTSRGVMLTHDNLLFTAEAIEKALPVDPRQELLLFLPLAHVFARMAVFVALQGNLIVAFAEGFDKIAANMREVRPHFIPAPPRVFEKIREKVLADADAAGGAKAAIFNWALAVGLRHSGYLERRETPPLLNRAAYVIANALVFRKLQSAMGGRLQFAVCGSAPLDPDIARFFHAFGILILEGIGMTENCAFSHVNRLERFKFGTVGLPGDGVEHKIAEDGELLTRGRNTMVGYNNDPEATAQTIGSENWLHTGDIGEIDADGYLKITDRKKNIIITAGGKNIAPARIERILCASSYISQALAIGDRRKYLTALVAADAERVRRWAESNEVASTDWHELVRHSGLIALLENEIATANQRLASYETVKKFRIVPGEFSVDSGDLTPTLKLKRTHIMQKYAPLVEEMYSGD